MWPRRAERPIVVVNLIYIPLFCLLAWQRGSAEFLLYAGVIVAVAALILLKQPTVRFTPPILWGLTIWGLAHMAGGTVPIGEDVLYGLELIRIFPRLHILRYDQIVHAFGFGVATLVCHHLLHPYLKADIPRWGTLAILVLLMGSGVGAVNEVLEFSAVLLIPRTGVGGYENTLCDLVFNLIGGLLAIAYLTTRR